MKYVFNETTHQEFLSSLKTENDVMISSSDFFFHTEYDLSFLSFFFYFKERNKITQVTEKMHYILKDTTPQIKNGLICN